ncbi:hypothetical protein RchiOBHm_Chr4g0436641 [Rosa chinensis]|uniref:Uncharacterized protein n=1 Tax=Rosa chinensis TaxID=74649 RepID=A0A2P6R240_ROSCH|nr:uncharacterized protein LOC112197309 [Rosa chinensis]PRQ40496.1 hypothetical protein RchiOBHm_Chr4g0436641 [Rosa chinensis]
MYVTRPLSMYRRSPDSLSLPTPEGPNSGYLVLHDEESDETTCFGCCEDPHVQGLPFPQNKNLTVEYSSDDDDVAFIPVLDKPLSANTYHVIRRDGRHRGKVYTNSKEEDMADCCFGKTVQDVKPKPLDPSDIYQQIEIIPRKHRGYFTAKAVASDGFPPSFLRRKDWTVTMSTPHHYQLGEAPGLNASKRSGLPGFDFPLSKDCSEAMVVGKWHCPFLFIKEGGLELKHQMKHCMFYEMRLEQRWERIFDKYNEGKSNNANAVFVDAFVQREAVFIAGREAYSDNLDRVHVVDDFLWFKSSDGGGGERSVGLSMKIIERMKWEQERVGWVGGEKRKVRVEKTEKFGGTDGWNRFACYMLVERFVLKRMDRSLALLAYDFKHTHQIRCKWE